jgi:hypothetical protein
MTDNDQTPEGDPLETVTFWLTFPEGDMAISADLTKFNTAMARLRRAESQPPDQA